MSGTHSLTSLAFLWILSAVFFLFHLFLHLRQLQISFSFSITSSCVHTCSIWFLFWFFCYWLTLICSWSKVSVKTCQSVCVEVRWKPCGNRPAAAKLNFLLIAITSKHFDMSWWSEMVLGKSQNEKRKSLLKAFSNLKQRWTKSVAAKKSLAF